MSEPRYTPEMDDILAECLEAVLRGKQTIAECLQLYPQYADALKPALQVALLTARLKSPELDADRVDALETRLRARMAAQKPRKVIQLPFVPVAISRMAAAVAIVVLLAFGSGVRLVAASADSLPGEPLYGIKRLWEAIVLIIMSLTDQFDDFTLYLAEVRLDEVEKLDNAGRLDRTALADLYSATAKAISSADEAGEQAAVTAYMGEAKTMLETIVPPAEAAPVYRDLVALMTPAFGSDGRLQAPASEIPPSLSIFTVPAATATFTPPPTLTPTLSPTATSTDTPTATDTATANPTRTPRIPPTPTRTPSPSPTITPSLTPTLTPTSTWTPLPIPTVPTLIAPTRIPTQPGGGERTPRPDETLDTTAQMRETQQSVYLTQTAGPPAATSTSTP